jgi:hypothetical protein
MGLSVKSSTLCCARVIYFIMMPKAKSSKSCNLKQIIVKFGYYIFSTDGDILYCKMRDIKVAEEKRFMVQCISCKKSIVYLQCKFKTKRNLQMLLQQCSSKDGNTSLHFFRDLCSQMFIAFINIQFWAPNNEKLKNFLEVNCSCSIPDEPILRKNYFPVLACLVLVNIFRDILECLFSLVKYFHIH